MVWAQGLATRLGLDPGHGDPRPALAGGGGDSVLRPAVGLADVEDADLDLEAFRSGQGAPSADGTRRLPERGHGRSVRESGVRFKDPLQGGET